MSAGIPLPRPTKRFERLGEQGLAVVHDPPQIDDQPAIAMLVQQLVQARDFLGLGWLGYRAHQRLDQGRATVNQPGIELHQISPAPDLFLRLCRG